MPVTFTVTADNKTEEFKVVQNTATTVTTTKKLAVSSVKPNNYIKSSDSGFLVAAINAYNNHYHLVIDPKDVWISILNILQIYIDKNANLLRNKFVSHNGKKQLTVCGNKDLYTSDYKELCDSMYKEIISNIDDLYIADLFLTEFSTTTPDSRLVSIAMLMGSMKKYFGYGMEFECGLPEVTLLGNVEDWELLLQKSKEVVEFDCGNSQMIDWEKMLTPVLEKLLESANGQPDIEWWKKICSHLQNGSGPDYSSGWITVFTPYDSNGEWIGNVMSVPDEFSDDDSLITSVWPILDLGLVCSGKVEVPITINDNGTLYETMLVAGHLGVFGHDDGKIQAYNGWELWVLNSTEDSSADVKKIDDKL